LKRAFNAGNEDRFFGPLLPHFYNLGKLLFRRIREGPVFVKKRWGAVELIRSTHPFNKSPFSLDRRGFMYKL
jgi:hypothetical protein